MDSKELSAKLKEQEEKLPPIIQELDDLYNKIKSEMPKGAEIWIRKTVQEFIEYYSEVTKSLGIEKLKKLKDKLETLITQLPELIQKEFNNKKIWPHYKKEDNTQSYNYAYEEFHAKTVFRNVVSNLGALLNEYGYNLNKPKHAQLWQTLTDGKFRYGVGIDDKHLPESIIQNYSDKLKSFKLLSEQIEDTKFKLSKATACEMWNEVN